MGLWWKENQELLKKERYLILEFFPELSFSEVDNTIFVHGELYIDAIMDSYEIEINIPDNYPKSIPILREIGGEIPRHLDRHINQNGTCCVCVKPAERIHWPIGSSIIDFIKNLVIPFLLNQYHYDACGRWIAGDYSHGDRGVLEFYAEQLQVNNPLKVLKILKEVKKAIINQSKKCPCLSGKTIKKCHLKNISSLKKIIDQDILCENYNSLQKLIYR